MKLQMTGTVVRNDPGVQTYFGESFVSTPWFPFDPGDEFQAIAAIDASAIVLLPADLHPPPELTLYDPETHRLTITDSDSDSDLELDPTTDPPTMHTRQSPNPEDSDSNHAGGDGQ